MEHDELKDITDLNLHKLELALAAAIRDQVGGNVEVHLSTLKVGLQPAADLEFTFRALDESGRERPSNVGRTNWRVD